MNEKSQSSQVDCFSLITNTTGPYEKLNYIVLCHYSYCFSALVFEEYKKISGRDIEDSIKREMSGCLEDVFLAIGLSLL